MHEQELERLRAELKTKSRLLAAVKKYKEICEEEKELAVSEVSSICFNQRSRRVTLTGRFDRSKPSIRQGATRSWSVT